MSKIEKTSIKFLKKIIFFTILLYYCHLAKATVKGNMIYFWLDLHNVPFAFGKIKQREKAAKF